MAMSGFRRKKELSRTGEWPPGLEPSLTADGKQCPLRTWGLELENTFLFLRLPYKPWSLPFAQNPTVFLPFMMLPLDPLLGAQHHTIAVPTTNPGSRHLP